MLSSLNAKIFDIICFRVICCGSYSSCCTWNFDWIMLLIRGKKIIWYFDCTFAWYITWNYSSSRFYSYFCVFELFLKLWPCCFWMWFTGLWIMGWYHVVSTLLSLVFCGCSILVPRLFAFGTSFSHVPLLCISCNPPITNQLLAFQILKNMELC